MIKFQRSIAFIFIDACLIGLSIYVSYLLRFDFKIRPEFVETFMYVIPVQTLLVVASFYSNKIYKRIWQYASVGDLISIFKGTVTGSILFFCFHQFVVANFAQITVPRSIFIISAIISFLAVGGSRFLWRITRDNYYKIQPHHRRALIIGAGEAGIMVVRELKHTRSEFYPVAFIDDNEEKRNYEVMGIPVVGNRHDIPKAVKEYNIDDIIVAIPSASRLEISKIINICKSTGCQIKIIPRVNDLISGKISVNMIRNVDVEDLLGREPVKVDLEQISGYLKDQVVMITGAGGSIGSEICRQVASVHPKQLILLGHGENSIYDIEMELKKKAGSFLIEPVIADIQDKCAINNLFGKYKPGVVFHAAAHKHVPLMEKNPLEAVKNNILGTYNVAEAAHRYGANSFVMISTDKAVNPANVMGASKRIAEMIVQAFSQVSNTRFAAVRFGNVLGSRGSVVPLFKKQIEEGGPVTVTHPDMVRYFMTITEAVQLVIQAGAMANDGEVFVLDMGKPVKIDDLARDLIRLSGLEPDKDIRILYTGIRPGEKLFEELLTGEEGTVATKHDRIFISKSPVMDYNEMLEMLRRFEELAARGTHPSPDEIRKELSRWVNSYHTPDYTKNEALQESRKALKASLEIAAALENNNPVQANKFRRIDHEEIKC